MTSREFWLIMDYLFKKINKYELNRQIGEEAKEELDSSYIQRNCKFFVYARMVDSNTNPESYNVKKYANYCIHYAKHLTLTNIKCTVWSLKKLDRAEVWIVKHLQSYVRKFIYRKMRFIVNSYGVGADDIEADLMLRGIQALRKNYPFYKSELHAINTVKTAIHNLGIDIIIKYTRQKNNRLNKTSDGFESTLVDFNVLENYIADDEGKEKSELSMSLKSLEYKMNKRGCLYIVLARGDYNKEFSEFLGSDNTEYCEKNYSRYLGRIRTYLGVSKEEVDRFLAKLRKHLI
jgi:hypothetical protein